MPCTALLFAEPIPVTRSCYSLLPQPRATFPTPLQTIQRPLLFHDSFGVPQPPTSLGLALSRHLSYYTTFRLSLSGYLSIPLRNFGNAGTIYRATRRFRQQTLCLQRTIPVAIAPYWRI